VDLPARALEAVQVAGVAISLAGVLAILSQGSLALLLAFRLNAGDLFVILSMLMWSVYTIALRWRPAGLHPLSFLFVLAVIGDRACSRCGSARWRSGHFIVWTWQGLAALVSVALFSSVLAYIFWNRGVEEVGAPVAGLFVHLMPVYGVFLAWIFLGETLVAYHVAGIALILAGSRSRAKAAVSGRSGRRTARCRPRRGSRRAAPRRRPAASRRRSRGGAACPPARTSTRRAHVERLAAARDARGALHDDPVLAAAPWRCSESACPATPRCA
jgi:hypothetical protein